MGLCHGVVPDLPFLTHALPLGLLSTRVHVVQYALQLSQALFILFLVNIRRQLPLVDGLINPDAPHSLGVEIDDNLCETLNHPCCSV